MRLLLRSQWVGTLSLLIPITKPWRRKTMHRGLNVEAVKGLLFVMVMMVRGAGVVVGVGRRVAVQAQGVRRSARGAHG